MKSTKYALTAALVLVALMAPRAVLADSVTYTYTGNEFTTFATGYSCGTTCSVDGSFTLAAPLVAGTTTLLTPSVYDFYVGTSGSPAFTNTNGASLPAVYITTNAADQITDWVVELLSSGNTYPAIVTCNNPDDSLQPFGYVLCAGIGNIGTVANDDLTTPTGYGGYGGYAAEIGNDPGSWSVTGTPEPSAAMLLGTGLLGLIAVWRRKRLA